MLSVVASQAKNLSSVTQVGHLLLDVNQLRHDFVIYRRCYVIVLTTGHMHQDQNPLEPPQQIRVENLQS